MCLGFLTALFPQFRSCQPINIISFVQFFVCFLCFLYSVFVFFSLTKCLCQVCVSNQQNQINKHHFLPLESANLQNLPSACKLRSTSCLCSELFEYLSTVPKQTVKSYSWAAINKAPFSFCELSNAQLCVHPILFVLVCSILGEWSGGCCRQGTGTFLKDWCLSQWLIILSFFICIFLDRSIFQSIFAILTTAYTAFRRLSAGDFVVSFGLL